MDQLPVGIQLFGLRRLLDGPSEKFGAAMARVKDLGYDGVELAGLYGLAPERLRDILGETGLEPVSAHVQLAEMAADPEKTARDYGTIGCRWIAVPFLMEKARPGAAEYEKTLADMTRVGRVLKDYGIGLMYHNHNFEFETMPDGTFGLDDIFAKVPADLLWAEPDTCWIRVAGQDPAKFIEKHTQRCPVVHLKDFVMEGKPRTGFRPGPGETFEFRPVGFGQQLWEPILDASRKAGAQWVVVEQDDPAGLTELECARRSREYLRILGW